MQDLLYRALDASALRQRVIANNVANANTPGFKRSYVAFEDYIKSAVERRDLSGVAPRVLTDRRTTMRDDGNNVDIDHEMVLMAANAIHNQALTQQVTDRFALMRYVVNEGRR
jgi:flagellar basal-body rod protein FlgB